MDYSETLTALISEDTGQIQTKHKHTTEKTKNDERQGSHENIRI